MANYRTAYGLFACSGILFNHESPLRPMRFVTRKVVAAAARIAAGIESGPLRLGNLDVWRDSGWAPEYVEVIWRMLQTDLPGDYIVATGHSWALQDFVAEAFGAFDLNWRDHLKLDESLCRPSTLYIRRATPSARRGNSDGALRS